jgi:hypothetical protein
MKWTYSVLGINWENIGNNLDASLKPIHNLNANICVVNIK